MFLNGLRIGLSVALFCAIELISFMPRAVAGEYSQVVTAGVSFHTGDVTKSLNGAMSYFLGLRAEKRKGLFRPESAVELALGSGLAYVGADQPNFTLYEGRFVTGIHVFPFTIERFQPFLGGNGIIGWSFLKLPSPPTGVEPNTQSIIFGYELKAGIDMRLGNADGNAIRLESSYSFAIGNLAGQTGFVLSSFRFSLGMVF